MAEFPIWLQYISKQHMGAELNFYLEYSINVLPKPDFSYATQSELGGGGRWSSSPLQDSA